MKLLPFDTVVHLTLFKLYEATAFHGEQRVDAAQISELIGDGVTTSFVKTAYKQLTELKEIRVSYTQGTAFAEILPIGIRLVEAELKKSDSIMSRFRDLGLHGFNDELIVAAVNIPAADRFVEINHNEPPVSTALVQLQALENDLLTSNEAGAIFGDDKIALAAEIGALRSMLSAARLRSSYFLEACRKSLGWIAEKAGSAAIGEAAKIALRTIFDWLT